MTIAEIVLIDLEAEYGQMKGELEESRQVGLIKLLMKISSLDSPTKIAIVRLILR